MQYRSIRCGDINGKAESNNLPGALAANQDFFMLDGEMFINYPVSRFVSNAFQQDYTNNIFVGEAGAIADAYDFGKMTSDQTHEAIQKIINEKKQMYPDYDFAILPGAFPIEAFEGMDAPEGDMSTHILYITDYEQHLNNSLGHKSK